MEFIPLRDGQVRFVEQLFQPEESERWFALLRDECQWRQEQIRLFGRWLATPRLSCWHGDPEAVYSYSGLRLLPAPWTGALRQIKQRVEAVSGVNFNSVLLNYYRDGRDSMGWHSDDEPELGKRPLIGSLSLGAMRRFQLRHKNIDGLRMAIDLPGGSYLEMSGTTQHHWRHCIPRVTRKIGAGPRINLTFRTIVTANQA